MFTALHSFCRAGFCSQIDLVKQVRTPPVRPADMVRSGRVLLTSARKSKEKS
ncbi:hypothetical protein CLOSYM_03533 [[Clostridium] symbiosum ATCC 14940]|uniref:Uncharacterized protein n=1 Tax=[Clostridium] symbiosum ATCC 14940 TaxID=411472 RepID=A0ABC9TUC1_CLOSY|nr:hypothetical protein CLOSYM_03533 [[Clostridium] symbiosum ATCC 14940]